MIENIKQIMKDINKKIYINLKELSLEDWKKLIDWLMIHLLKKYDILPIKNKRTLIIKQKKVFKLINNFNRTILIIFICKKNYTAMNRLTVEFPNDFILLPYKILNSCKNQKLKHISFFR